MGGYDVHVAFDDDGGLLLTYGRCGLVEGVQGGLLIEDRGGGCVDVLGIRAVEGASSEPRDTATAVENRDHETPEEKVAEVALIVASEQSRLGSVPQIGVQRREVCPQPVAALGTEAELEFFDRLVVDAAVVEVLERRAALR